MFNDAIFDLYNRSDSPIFSEEEEKEYYYVVAKTDGSFCVSLLTEEMTSIKVLDSLEGDLIELPYSYLRKEKKHHNADIISFLCYDEALDWICNLMDITNHPDWLMDYEIIKLSIY